MIRATIWEPASGRLRRPMYVTSAPGRCHREETMFCSACGQQLQPNQQTCPKCGRPVAGAIPSTPMQPQAYPPMPVSYAASRVERHLQTLGILWLVYAGWLLITWAFAATFMAGFFGSMAHHPWGPMGHGPFGNGFPFRRHTVAHPLYHRHLGNPVRARHPDRRCPAAPRKLGSHPGDRGWHPDPAQATYWNFAGNLHALGAVAGCLRPGVRPDFDVELLHDAPSERSAGRRRLAIAASWPSPE